MASGFRVAGLMCLFVLKKGLGFRVAYTRGARAHRFRVKQAIWVGV